MIPQKLSNKIFCSNCENADFYEMKDITSTNTVNRLQINCNQILDWHYTGIDASKSG